MTSASVSSAPLVSVRVVVAVAVAVRDSPLTRNGSGRRPSRISR